MERVFIDKLFAAEAYVRKAADPHRAFEAAKHIYDLAVIREHEKTVHLLSDNDQMKRLLNIRITEEKDRLEGGDPDSDYTAYAASYRKRAGCIDRHFRHHRLCGESAKDR